jgi:hypothetical protein
VKAAAEAGGEALKFIDLDKAARSQSHFAASAQKAGHAFHGLAGGIRHTLENLARYALSPLQILFPAGLAVGLFGLGAGLAGLGIAGASVYGLDRGAADISDRRRQAMGLGVSYGSLGAFGLDFSRFGVDEGTLGGVAGGIYDVTSPQYLGLLSSGSTGRGDTSAAAIALIRSIPKLLGGVPDEAVGPIARSHNLTSILDLPTIIRLRNHPEEIEDQVKRYQQDRKTLDIGKDAQEKWASFDATIKAAGQKIESALGRNLVALTPGLTKISDGIVNIIDALVDSGTITDALNTIEGGLRGLTGYIGSEDFKEKAKSFVHAIEALVPYAEAIAKVAGVAGRLGVAGYKLWSDPNYNPTAAGLLGDVTGIKGTSSSPRSSSGLGGSSIRYYAGRGKDRIPYGGVIDSTTGKLLPGPSFKYSPGYNPTPQAPSPVTNENGGVVLPAVTDQGRAYRNTGTITLPGPDEKLHTYTFVTGGGGRGSAPSGTYDVGEFATGGSIGDRWTLTEAGQPHDTAWDPALNAERSALRIHMAHGDRTLGCIGILGGDRVFADFENNLLYVLKKNGGHVRLRLGSLEATSITKRMTKTSTGEAAARSLPSRPVSPTPGHIRAPLELPGAMPPQAAGERLGFDNQVGLRNMALRRRGHVLDHMSKGSPPGPIIINNQTGGGVQVTVSRHEATQ